MRSINALLRSVALVGFGTLLLCSFSSVQPARAESRVAVDFFYDDLGPEGYWVEDPYYGTVWYPRGRGPDWQPYVYGRWVWTADYGWYWDSDEPWGWAVYHYGRWVYTAHYGWVWVPDEEWGPAWVDWRYGDGCVGWAPMPPEARWRSGAFVSFGVDLAGPKYHPSWVFVSETDFARGNIGRRRIPRSRNAAMLHASTRVTNYVDVDGRIVNRSLDVGRISAAAKVRINAVPVALSETYIKGGLQTRSSGHVSVYRPPVFAKARVRTYPREDSYDRVEESGRIDVRPPDRPSVDVETGVGAGMGIGGRGAGVGIGVGGGLRIGR